MLRNGETFRLEIIPNGRYDDVIQHLRKTFFTDEPLNKAVDLCRPGEGHWLLEQHSLSSLKDNVSIMAVTGDGEIAGVAVNGILHGNENISNSLAKLNDIDDEKFKKIFRLLYEENLKVNLFQQFNVEKAFEIRILSVDSKFRGNGLAKLLLQKSEQIAREQGFVIMKTDATGIYSQRVAASLGFSTRFEVRYSDYVDDQGRPIFQVERPHDTLKIMFKHLC